jgi:hypothetical protein
VLALNLADGTGEILLFLLAVLGTFAVNMTAECRLPNDFAHDGWLNL